MLYWNLILVITCDLPLVVKRLSHNIEKYISLQEGDKYDKNTLMIFSFFNQNKVFFKHNLQSNVLYYINKSKLK